jgi:hypothetical protein
MKNKISKIKSKSRTVAVPVFQGKRQTMLDNRKIGNCHGCGGTILFALSLVF